MRNMLSSEHRTHLHHIFYRICSDRGWALGLPTSFDYGYLSADTRTIHARIVHGGPKPLVLIHPLAFDRCRGNLVIGLLHHEMVHHLLGPDVPHGSGFDEVERGWSRFYLFKEEVSDFARYLARTRVGYVLTCMSCGREEVTTKFPAGKVACRRCCEDHSNGEYHDDYNLHIGVRVMSTA